MFLACAVLFVVSHLPGERWPRPLPSLLTELVSGRLEEEGSRKRQKKTRLGDDQKEEEGRKIPFLLVRGSVLLSE